jgi:hypothetical protein
VRHQAERAAEREPALRDAFERLAGPERDRIGAELPEAKGRLAELEDRHWGHLHFESSIPTPSAVSTASSARSRTLATRWTSRSTIAATLRRGGRQRGVDARAVEIQAPPRTPQLEPPPVVADAMGAAVSATVCVLGEMNRQVGNLEAELRRSFERHPEAEIIRSLPGLGVVVGARVLGEFRGRPHSLRRC